MMGPTVIYPTLKSGRSRPFCDGQTTRRFLLLGIVPSPPRTHYNKKHPKHNTKMSTTPPQEETALIQELESKLAAFVQTKEDERQESDDINRIIEHVAHHGTQT